MLYYDYNKTTAVAECWNTPQPAQVNGPPTQRLKPHRQEVVYPVLPHLARYGYYKTSSVCARASDFRTLSGFGAACRRNACTLFCLPLGERR